MGFGGGSVVTGHEQSKREGGRAVAESWAVEMRTMFEGGLKVNGVGGR